MRGQPPCHHQISMLERTFIHALSLSRSDRRQGRIQPLAGAARRHRRAHVHWRSVWIERLQCAADADRCRLDNSSGRLDLLHRSFHARHFSGVIWHVGGTQWTTKDDGGELRLLLRRPAHLRHRREAQDSRASLHRLRLHRRHRTRTRLHFACVHAYEMVSRPARHGHRNGDHGIRRWRSHRRAFGRKTHGPFQVSHIGWCRRDIRRHGVHLCGFDAVWGNAYTCSSRGLETGRLGATGASQADGDKRQRRGGRCLEDAAVLVPLGSAVYECQRRHRHSWSGVEDVFGYVWRQRSSRWRLRRPAEYL